MTKPPPSDSRSTSRSVRTIVVAGVLVTVLAGCGPADDPGAVDPPVEADVTEPHTPAEPAPDPELEPGGGPDDLELEAPATPEADDQSAERPDWLGTRPLPLRPDGLGEIRDTPEELRDRQLPPPSTQPTADTTAFAAEVETVGDDVAQRSTWSPQCPVGLEDLRHVTVTFWGFDDRAYTGELLVHQSAAEALVDVFATLHEARFPIEEMRIVTSEELDAPPTGDGNNTTAFVCRTTVESERWSQHAYGLAVDINPFHNPYVRGDVVIPELASAYADRDDDRPGMIQRRDVVTQAFAEIGWGWGGDWRTASDPMHFSASGR